MPTDGKAALARRALTLRSRYRANVAEEKVLSSQSAMRRRLSLMNLRASSNRSEQQVRQRIEFSHQLYDRTLGASFGDMK